MILIQLIVPTATCLGYRWWHSLCAKPNVENNINKKGSNSWFPCHRGDFWNICDSCSYANVWNRELDKPCLDFFENFWAEVGHRILHLPRHYSRLSVLMAVSYITSSGEETLLCLQMSLLWPLTPAPLWPVRISTVFLLSSNAYSWFLSRNIHCLTRAKLHTSCTAEILNKSKEAQFNLKLLSSALITKSLCKM